MLNTQESEQAILGALIVKPDLLPTIKDTLSVDDFVIDTHKMLYSCLCNMKSIDESLLAQRLTDKTTLTLSESYMLIAGCLGKAAPERTVEAHADKLKGVSKMRRLKDVAASITSRLEAGEGYDSVMELAQKSLNSIATTGGQEAHDLGSVAHYVESDIAEAMRIACPYNGIPWGFKRLDALTGGTGANVFTVIAARPSVGKTAISLHIARNMSNSRWNLNTKSFESPGHRVLYFSLEMSKEQLMRRWLAMDSNVHLNLIRSPQHMRDDHKSRLSDAIQSASNYPIWIDDDCGLSIQEIKRRSRMYKRKHGIEAIIVDHLGKIKAEGEKRYLEVGNISNGLKELSKELAVPIIALHHIGRGASESDEPHMGHLRESGNIEQDADIVVLLHTLKDDGHNRELLVKVDKNRDGATDRIRMAFDKRTQTFTELSDV
jgi:replicative DNA helicase